MANPHESEVTLVLKGVTYKLKLPNRAACDIEHATSKSILEIISALFKGNVWAAAAFLYGGLLTNHPGISYDQAIDLVPINDLLPFMKTMFELVSVSFPTPEESGDDAAVAANPQ